MPPVLLGVALMAGMTQVPDGGSLPLVPAPRVLEMRTGSFEIGAGTAVYLDGPADAVRDMAERWAARVRLAAGVPLPVMDGTPDDAPGAIVLRLHGESDVRGERWDPGDESYALDVSPDRITVEAREPPGLFRGLQTLRRLLPVHVELQRRAPPGVRFALPALRIDDAPRFPYRGMHLDVGRHFFPPELVKRYIDQLALWGFNAFHWHLTEDQGWRIEIRAYPRLTEVGAYRRETMLGRNFEPYVGDGVPHGGFYTQDEVRDIVAYAAERHVTVIPEIEMPGHSLAALAAYPELACTAGPFEVGTRWGIYDDIVCPSERTFEFFETVLEEVMQLFPGRYIHIGGDEAPKTRWEESPLAQEVIRREGLADEHELQSWFTRRIERFLARHGRRLIGWDEILEGGIAPEATVMSWRGMAGGIEAARAGHDVIMAPTSHVYLDYYQGAPDLEPLAIGGFLPLERVYAFEPVPPELSPDEAAHVLGGQGNVWTEYMKTWDRVEYMAFPRMLALAEVLWSPRERRDWTDFMARLGPQLARLDALGVNYRVPDPIGLEDEMLTLDDRATVFMGPVWQGAEIRYTLDGTQPTSASPRYEEPFMLDLSRGPVPLAARLIMRDGRMGDVRSTLYRRVSLRPGSTVGATAPGLRREYFDGEFASVDSLPAAPTAAEVVGSVSLPPDPGDRPFALRFTGWLRVPASGIHAFHLTSDDGSRLVIGDEVVVDNDGAHGPLERTGKIALAAGLHPIRVDYFQAGGGSALSLEVTTPDGRRFPVPSRWLLQAR